MRPVGTRAPPLGPGRPRNSFIALSSLCIPPSLAFYLPYRDDLFTAGPNNGGGPGGGPPWEPGSPGPEPVL